MVRLALAFVVVFALIGGIFTGLDNLKEKLFSKKEFVMPTEEQQMDATADAAAAGLTNYLLAYGEDYFMR